MKLLLDSMEFSRKPIGYEVASISKRIINQEVDISIKDLAEEIIKGKSFLPVTLKETHGIKKRKIENWFSQEIIALDFDDGLSVNDALNNPFIKDNAAFLYTTFSHTPTNNKFRVVFALDKPIYDYKYFKCIISFLLEMFPQADKACSDGVRLFFGGKEMFEIDMSNRLMLDEIIHSKRGFETDKEYISNMSVQKPPSGKHSPNNNNRKLISNQHCANVQDILNKDIQSLHIKLKPSTIQLSNMIEVTEYLKKQDLKSFLGVNNSSCFDIFHEEVNPSASIFPSHLGNGHYLYKCHSEKYPFCGTIFQIVERLLKCSNIDAEDFLMKVFKVELIETEKQKEMRRILDANKRLLMSSELNELYPNFYKVINPFREDLYILFDLVKEYLPSGDNPEIMFYHSVRKIGERLMLKHDSASKRINFFVLLELMKKLDEIEIPNEIQETLLSWKQNNKYRYHNSVYSIPSYTYDLLSIIDSKCKIWIENGCTLRTISYEGVSRNFGVQEANRVFPQDKDKVIPELNEFVVRKIEESMLSLIHTNGFTTEKEVMDRINLYFQGQKQFKQDQLKRCMGEIMEGYCLIRVRLNKELRVKLKYDGKGYPFVIMYESDYENLFNQESIAI